jgi:zinc/manganese transport system substrate-binding protein
VRRTALRAVVALLSLGGVSRASAEAPLQVVTLSTVLTEVATAVGGDAVQVVGLVQPGVDPHTFNPSPADVRAMVDADLVLASGLDLEGYLARLVAGAGPRGRVIAVGDRMPGILALPRAGGPPERDPHWWQSIGNVAVAAEVVRAELARERPAQAPLFQRNAEAYRAHLAALQAWAAAEVARLPAARRELVTSHDAFGYFARDFGFTIHPVSGLSTEAEADGRHMAELVDLIRRDQVGAVFLESSVNPSLVENLVRETGVRLGGTLYADGLGPPGSDADTYAAMYRRNVATIVGALLPP